MPILTIGLPVSDYIFEYSTGVNVFFFLLLLLVGAVGQLSSDLYLPSLPFIADALDVSMNMVQISFSLFLLGLAIAQLIYAPLSDWVGRRKPLLGGISICLLGSLLCLTAHSLEALLLGRFIQGLGAGVGDSLSRAILHDRYQGEKLARYASFLSIGHVGILAAAPFIGGYIQHLFDWRGVFSALAFYQIILWWAIVRYLPETNRFIGQSKFIDVKKNVVCLLTDRQFVCFSLITSLSYGGIMAWLSVSPAILELQLGFLPQQVGWVALVLGVIFAAGSVFNAKKVLAVGLYRMIRYGLYLMFSAGLLMYVLSWRYHGQLLSLFFPVALYLFGVSLVFSNGFAFALKRFSSIAGLGCAIFSFLQILGGVLTSSLMATLTYNTPNALALMMIGLTGLSLFILLYSVKNTTPRKK